MRAASLNFIDVAVATGNYPVDRFPLVPVCDGAGEVTAVGPEVEEYSIGQRVIAHCGHDRLECDSCQSRATRFRRRSVGHRRREYLCVAARQGSGCHRQFGRRTINREEE
jgi:NADPH:quinone reductase-like Zn-dependent oxidoreductase